MADTLQALPVIRIDVLGALKSRGDTPAFIVKPVSPGLQNCVVTLYLRLSFSYFLGPVFKRLWYIGKWRFRLTQVARFAGSDEVVYVVITTVCDSVYVIYMENHVWRNCPAVLAAECVSLEYLESQFLRDCFSAHTASQIRCDRPALVGTVSPVGLAWPARSSSGSRRQIATRSIPVSSASRSGLAGPWRCRAARISAQ